MGVSDAKTAQLAVVIALQGSKRRLRVGFNAKEQVVPSRHVELIYPQLSGSDQPTRLGVSPSQSNTSRMGPVMGLALGIIGDD